MAEAIITACIVHIGVAGIATVRYSTLADVLTMSTVLIVSTSASVE